MKVYYDQDCPVCARFISSVKTSTQKENFECRPMQKIDKNDLLSKEFHIITHDGKIYRKFDAVVKIAEMYPQWRPFIPLIRMPVIYSILSFGYEVFAAHRYGISRLLNRFTLLKIVLILVTISSLLLSPRLWLSSRLYPLVPFFSFLPTIPFPFDYVIFLIMLALLLVSLFKTNARKYFLVFSIIMGFSMLLDQSRLQPEFYQFILMFVTLSIYSWNVSRPHEKERMLTICCFIIAGIYFYSGLQKLNISFLTVVFPWFIEPFLHMFPQNFRVFLLSSGLFIPFIEMGIGICLLTKRFRFPAVIVAIFLHLFILLSLGPLGHNWNSVVWPWNIAMCFFVVILFWQNNTFSLSKFLASSPFAIVIFILCGILPAFSFFNAWDSYLSASLYSGNTENAQILIRTSGFSDLNSSLRKYVSKRTKHFTIINIDSWSYNEMNVPSYPQTRIFKGIAQSLCQKLHNPRDLQLTVSGKPNWITGISKITQYSCITI